MPPIPCWIADLLSAFAPLFSNRVWQHAQILIAGAILAPGKRTVTSALRVMGLSFEVHFQNYHRVLNRASWSNLAASRILMQLLVAAFAPTGPLVLGLDDTIERREGVKIAAKGIDRDPVRSSHSHFVKASSLRWLCLMLLVPIRWAARVWALPFMTVLTPSERFNTEHGKPHRTLTDWAQLMLRVIQRWLPEPQLVIVADSAYAVIDWLSSLQQLRVPVTVITRLRLDAALYEPALERQPGRMGRPRVKGARLPTLAALLEDAKTIWERVRVINWYGEGEGVVEIASQTAVWYHTGKLPVPIRWVLIRDPDGKFKPQALLCTDLWFEPQPILEWFVLGWCLEVRFEEARAHLGVESQRRWSDLAIARVTPILFGLFSLVGALAHDRWGQAGFSVRQAAWYEKTLPTFSDALAEVRRGLWEGSSFRTSCNGQERLHQVVYEFLSSKPECPASVTVFTPASTPSGATPRSPEQDSPAVPEPPPALEIARTRSRTPPARPGTLALGLNSGSPAGHAPDPSSVGAIAQRGCSVAHRLERTREARPRDRTQPSIRRDSRSAEDRTRRRSDARAS